MGQALGTAASLAIRKHILPAGMKEHITELQQTLIQDDAYLPWKKQVFSDITSTARLEASNGDPEPVRDGINRPVKDNPHCWFCQEGRWVAYTFTEITKVKRVTLVLDSGLDQNVALSYHQKDNQLTSPPDVMPKLFRIDGLIGNNWQELLSVSRNHQRFCYFNVDRKLDGIRFILEKTWGGGESRVYTFYVD